MKYGRSLRGLSLQGGQRSESQLHLPLVYISHADVWQDFPDRGARDVHMQIRLLHLTDENANKDPHNADLWADK